MLRKDISYHEIPILREKNSVIVQLAIHDILIAHPSMFVVVYFQFIIHESLKNTYVSFMLLQIKETFILQNHKTNFQISVNNILKRDNRDILCNSELQNAMPEKVRDDGRQV